MYMLLAKEREKRALELFSRSQSCVCLRRREHFHSSAPIRLSLFYSLVWISFRTFPNTEKLYFYTHFDGFLFCFNTSEF